MSPFGHGLVISLLLVLCQITKSEITSTPKPSDALNFSHTNGILSFKIRIEKEECVANATNENSTTKPPTGRRSDAGDNYEDLGTEANPAETCRAFSVDDNYYIYPADKFLVYCDRYEEATCININETPIQNETKLMTSAITLSEEVWLSQTTFTMPSLYANVKLSQISYLQRTSTKVIQKIRYYYKTKTNLPTSYPDVTKLKALLWNDHLVGPKITKQMPLNYTVEERDWCWGKETDRWMCTNITFEDNSNKRLPVTDFYIQEVREEAVSNGTETVQLYFEFLKLCFY